MFRALRQELDRASRHNEASMAGMGADMARAFGHGFSTHIRRIVAAAGFVGVIHAIAGAVKAVADLGDTAQDIGISAQALQVWNRMAIAAGQSAEVMAR